MSTSQPRCGSSDARNRIWEENFSLQKFFSQLVDADQPVIFDVGAHQGESIAFFREVFETCEIHSFEPDPSNFEILQSCATAVGTRAHRLAISDRVGEAEFFRQDISHLGGLAPINAESRDSLGYAKRAPNSSITVPVTTIDTYCEDHGIGRVDLLKIDVQGFEGEVLAGAARTLRTVDVVMVEISLYDFYDKATDSFFEVSSRMRESGFALWDISKVSKNPQNLRTDWFEAVFVNASRKAGN